MMRAVSWNWCWLWLAVMASCLAEAPRCSGEEGVSRARAKGRTESTKGRESAAFSSEHLVRALRASRLDVRIHALLVAERHLSHPDLPEALWKAIQHDIKGRHVSDSTFAAIRLHGRTAGPDVDAQQDTLLSSSDPRVVIVAAESLAVRQVGSALPRILDLADRPEHKNSYGFRHALVGAVGAYAHGSGIEFLISTMTRSNGQLKFEASRQLARRTGQEFGGNAAAWRSWWSKNRNDFKFPDATTVSTTGATVASRVIEWDHAVPQFYGTPVYAQRVVFVIDQSSSMQGTVDGVTRLREAQRELEAVLDLLPLDAEFNVLAYETFVTPWQPRLAPATAMQKADALQFVNSLEAIRRTATYDALADALSHDENIEAVLFLSDGEPNTGRIVDRAAIVDDITRLNAFRHTSIQTIGIDATGVSAEFLQKLSDLNFGTYRAIR